MPDQHIDAQMTAIDGAWGDSLARGQGRVQLAPGAGASYPERLRHEDRYPRMRAPARCHERAVGQYPAMFTRLLDGHGFTFESWHVEGMDFPISMRSADGWLITGSRHGAYEDHAFIPPCWSS